MYIFDKTTLQNAVAVVSQSAAKGNLLPPAFSHVVVSIGGSNATVRVIGIESSAMVSVPIETMAWTEPVEFSIPAKEFAGLLDKSTDEEVDLSFDGDAILFDSGGWQATLSPLPPEDIPPMPEVGEQVVSVPVEAFTDALSGVRYAAATDESRPVLTGIRLFSVAGNIYAEAADGFRAARAAIDTVDVSVEFSYLIPVGVATSIKKCAKLYGTSVANIFVNEAGGVAFAIGDAVISSLQLSGAYPELSNIFPETSQGNSILGRAITEEFLNALEFAGQLTNDTKIVEFEFAPKTNIVTLSGNNSRGTSTATCGIMAEDKTMEPQTIGLNGKYLTQALVAIDGVAEFFVNSDKHTPFMVWNMVQKHVIMPMHLKGD